jgi:hypothetical protein
MSNPRVAPATKNQVIELVIVALGSTHEGLKALRGVLASDPRLAVLDGAVDLEPVWTVLEAQPDFQREAATAAMCYVKGLEGRLGVQMRMPAALADLSAEERAEAARGCRARRENVDRLIEGQAPPSRSPALTEATAALRPRSDAPRRGRIISAVAGLVAVLSLAFVAYTVVSNLTGTPRYRTIDAAEFAGDIPIGSARAWGTEVRASLVDPAWMRQPEERRRRQLEIALDRLAQRSLTTLIVEDEGRRTRATAQLFGSSRRVQVRFY